MESGNLVLSRRQGESIEIGDDITIEIVRIGPEGVRVRITAPKEINIRRSELADERMVIEQ